LLTGIFIRWLISFHGIVAFWLFSEDARLFHTWITKTQLIHSRIMLSLAEELRKQKAKNSARVELHALLKISREGLIPSITPKIVGLYLCG